MEKGTTTCIWVERTCPICQKIFIPNEGSWVYKRKGTDKKVIYFCSWSCLNKYDLEHPKKIAIEQREDIIRLIKKGMKTVEIARELGIDRRKVQYWQQKMAKEAGAK